MIFSRARVSATVLFAVLAVLLKSSASPGSLEAQHPIRPLVGDTIPAADEPQEFARPEGLQPGPSLEHPVDRTEYILGPGDVLMLSIFGFRSEIFTLPVTPEGSVVVPTVGVLDVAGLSIEAAEQRIARQVRRFYQDVEVRVSLATIRSFKVFVVGEVPRPGVRQATPVTRVSEVIPTTTANSIARRNVVVRRAGSDTLRVDLARFLFLGHLDQNPTLREGDVVVVPVVDETIRVQGEVAFPGEYEYRQGESLAELLTLVNGGADFPAAAADTLRLVRFTDDPKGEIIAIATSDAAGELGQAHVLQAFDAIFVPRTTDFKEAETATITGEVVHPGTYPIEQGATTVRDLVRLAGGFTREASLLDAVLQRRPPERRQEPENQLQAIPPEFMSEIERRILQVTTRADETNVVIDFREVFADGGSVYNVRLQDGDLLHVPETRTEIAVVGAVTKPGLVSYEPGGSVDHFVGLAGGYTRRADKDDVVVLKAKLGNRLHREDVEFLEPGDQVVVPFEEPRTFMDRVREVETVFTTVSGIVLTVVGLERLWNSITN